LKRIYTATNLPDAHLLLHRLSEAGIEARVFNENAQSIAGQIPVHSAQPEVWVMDGVYEIRARELAEVHSRRSVPLKARTCPECGEENPGEFEVCWKCGLAFPPD
jgi:hypothetical protein